MGSPRFYQPTITRFPSLLFLIVFSLVLIALTEYAIRHLPANNANGIITTLNHQGSAEISSLVAIRLGKRSPQETAPTEPAPSDFLSVNNDAEPTVTGAPNPSDFQSVGNDEEPTVTGVPDSTDFLPVAKATSLLPTPHVLPASDFLPVDQGSTVDPIATSSDFLPVDPNTSIAFSPASTAFLPVEPTPSDNGEASNPESTDFLPVGNTLPTSSPLTVGAPAPTNFLPVNNGPTTNDNTATLRPVPLPNPISPAPSTVQSTTMTGVAAGESYTIAPGGTVNIEGQTFNTAIPTTATLPDGNVVVVGPTGAVSIEHFADKKQPVSVTPGNYVVGAFVPTILAVVFSIPWHLLASAIKEIEPFYQLHSANGELAENSICLDYRASVNAIATLKAIRRRHYLVWWSGLVSLIVLLLAPLASETVFIGFPGGCSYSVERGRVGCIPQLSVYPVAARVIQGILAFVTILTLGLAIAIVRKKSGVYANPLSIAGLATLFQDSRLIEDFRRLNSFAPNCKDIRLALQGNRYRVGAYNHTDGSPSYGMNVIHSNAAPVESHRTSSIGGKKYASVAVTPLDEHTVHERPKPSSSPWLHPATVTAFALFVLGLATLVIYYNRTGGDTGFERFMDSDAFGVSFLFTAVGVILKLYWTLIDDEIRGMEPYRQLLHGSAPASDSILLAPHSNPFTGIFHSLRHRHIFNAYISLVAILSEPLIVALANIPFKPGIAYQAYLVCTWFTVAILSMMLIGIVWMLCRKKMPGMYRRPDTIASVLLYLCGSRLTEGLRGMAEMGRRERDEVVVGAGRRYAMGSLIGVDGVEREGIDESQFVGRRYDC